MAEICALIAAMDSLWFQHIILLSQPISTVCCKSLLDSPLPSTMESCTSSESLDQTEDEMNLFNDSSISSTSKDDCSNDNIKKEKMIEATKERKRPTGLRLNIPSNRSRSKSSSPSFHRPSKSLNFKDDTDKSMKFQRTLSSRALLALEIEEVQGFMDLGFRFEIDQITPRTMSMIPGLQRLGGSGGDLNEHNSRIQDEGNMGKDEEVGKEVKKPYLSEAWFVKKPNSPLLRLRMARVTTSEEMKKCLMLWARTVATSLSSHKNDFIKFS